MARLIIGTAGHIDHGKSSLVRALTGTDPDRLPEEKRRGITIDLGFAFLDEIAAIIDVPGHEKFIRNMVAGAATIDFAVLVIAADDGIMPQTTEHLHILRLLGIEHGCVVITKIALADPAWVDLVEEQIRTATVRTFLSGSPIFRVDSLSGAGIAYFRSSLLAQLATLKPRAGRGIFRLPIDRVFAVKGRGTVVTGTVISGNLLPDSEVSLLPAGVTLRVKHLESHGKTQSTVAPGQRAALNLQGDVEQVARGQTVTTPHGLTATSRFAAVIESLPDMDPLADRQRVHVLIGTAEAIGRVQIVSRSTDGRIWAHIILEEPIVAAWHDRFIMRRYSPLETLGGGIVLDPDPPSLKSRYREQELAAMQALYESSIDHSLAAYVQRRSSTGISLTKLASLFASCAEDILQRLRKLPDLIEIDSMWMHAKDVAEIEATIKCDLKDAFAASKGLIGFSPASIRVKSLRMLPMGLFDAMIQRLIDRNELARETGLLRFPERNVAITPQQEALIKQISVKLSAAGFTPPAADQLAEMLGKPKSEIAKLLVLMERIGNSKRLGIDQFFDAAVFSKATATLKEALDQRGELSVADVSGLLNSSRKFVVPFLEYLDDQGITRRSGNVRTPGKNFHTLEVTK